MYLMRQAIRGHQSSSELHGNPPLDVPDERAEDGIKDHPVE
jgi:hypothetical protein